MATEGLHYPFADNFWGNEEASIQVIVERSRRSKQTSEQIRRLFEKRAQLEEEYGDRLLQIAQSPIGDHEEYGSTFSETLNDIPAATEAAARAHLDLAQQIKHHLELPLSTFVKDQKEVRQATLSKIEEARMQKALFISNATKAKDVYDMQCQHLIEMRQRLEDRSLRVGQEDIAKLQEQVALADQEYKKSIQELTAAYNQWYDEWRDVCDIFQSLEERRLHYLRSSLWAYANMMSSVHTIDDQSCERIRTSLESMEVGKDLDLFVQKRRTGQLPPEPAKYENYFENLKTVTKRSDVTAGSIVKPLPPIAPPGSLWGSKASDTEGNPKAEPEAKAIREITIPVVDEELRSVDVQLKRLPTKRTITGESLLSLSETPVPPVAANGLLNTPEPRSSNESRRRSKELLEIDPVTDATPSADLNSDNVNGKQPKTSSDHHSQDDAGSVSDFIISRSSIPRGTINDVESSTNIDSHKDDVSTTNQNQTEAAAAETTPVPEKKSSAGPSPPKSERRVSSHGILTRPPPLAISLIDQKHTLMASPVSIKRPMPGAVNTRNLNATTAAVDMSQPNSAITQESHVIETSTKVASPLKMNAPRSPQATASPSALSPESTTLARAPPPPLQPTTVPPRSRPDEPTSTPYMYSSNAEDVDLGIRPPPWGADSTTHVPNYNIASQPHTAVASSYPAENSPFLTRAAATMMTFPDQQQAKKLEMNRSTSPNLDVPPSHTAKSPSLASKMKTAFNKSPGAMPEKARTTDTMLKASKSESDSRVAARSATDPSTIPVHQIERLKERSNSRFSLSIFKRDKEGKRHRDKAARHMAGEQDSLHAPSLLSHTLSDNEMQQPPPSQTGSVPVSPGGSRGPDSALGLGLVSTTPDWPSQPPPSSKKADGVHISQRMSSLGMEQLRQRQDNNTPLAPNWQPSTTLADGTPILEYVQALWSYRAQIPDTEISFESNDVLAVITKQQDGWWEAEILDQRRRRRGLVPSNFMKIIKSL